MSLRRIIHQAEVEVAALAQSRYPCCRVFSFGAVGINPRHLAIWITTNSDAQRDALNEDTAFQRGLCDILRRAGYPAEAIELVGFAIESEETVRRDLGGNWWYAIK
jgi:hypothetical protein